MNSKLAKNLVLFAALYNTSAVIIFLIPGGLALFGVPLPYSPFWVWLPALLASFASIVLFLSSRDLTKYGAFPYWNGIIRITFAVIALLMNFKDSAGLFIGIIAIGDLLLGLFCVFVLPKVLNKTHKQLLTNS